MTGGARLRRRVWALGPRGPGSRIPEALRHDILDYARERQLRGAGLKQIAGETGLTRETIRNWLQGPALGRELVPVVVVPEVVDGGRTAPGHSGDGNGQAPRRPYTPPPP